MNYIENRFRNYEKLMNMTKNYYKGPRLKFRFTYLEGFKTFSDSHNFNTHTIQQNSLQFFNKVLSILIFKHFCFLTIMSLAPRGQKSGKYVNVNKTYWFVATILCCIWQVHFYVSQIRTKDPQPILCLRFF